MRNPQPLVATSMP